MRSEARHTSLRDLFCRWRSLRALAPDASAAVVTWDGDVLVGTTGNGFSWTSRFNWAADLLPSPSAGLFFGNPSASAGLIVFDGNQTANSLSFGESYTLGAYGTSNVLNNTTRAVVVNPGDFAVLNAAYDSVNGLALSGGGTLVVGGVLRPAAGTGKVTPSASSCSRHRQ